MITPPVEPAAILFASAATKLYEHDRPAPEVGTSAIVLLWRWIFGPRPPKQQGPCDYCGEMCDGGISYLPGVFFHRDCMQARMITAALQRKERRQIDIIKTALRELEAEKQNAEVSRGDGSASQPQ